MAIYHNTCKVISRQARDRNKAIIPGREVSTLAKAAYRSADRLHDDRLNKTFHYRARSQEVIHTGILAPDNAAWPPCCPAWLVSNEEQTGVGRRKQTALRERLWNTIETVERRKDSQLAREFELSLPIELTDAQRLALVRAWCSNEIVRRGFVADYAIHRSKDGRNPHAHVLCTMRPVDAGSPSGFGKKPDTAGKFNGRGLVGYGAKADLDDWRRSWADAQNAALAAAGSKARVDHRSLAAQGVERIPMPKIGVGATAMKRRGVAADPERVRQARWVILDNVMRPWQKDIKQTGEVRQYGTGASWWERDMHLRQHELHAEEHPESAIPSHALPRPAPAAGWQSYVQQKKDQQHSEYPHRS